MPILYFRKTGDFMEQFSLTDIKKKNLSDVYHYIYQNPSCSKQEIATALSVSLPTVSQHLTTLEGLQLIEKCGRLSSSVGRRATAYQVISDAHIAIGIELLPDKANILAVNLYGKIIAKETLSIAFEPTGHYLSKLKDAVQSFLKMNHYKEETILGIGLGVQGLISPDGSEFTYGKILNCTGFSIRTFADAFSVPCRFIHDAECACNSELWENPDIKDATYISLSYHLGGAIIVDGQLLTGHTGKSGTFEHLTLVPDGIDCYCGHKGCAECYCSANSLLTYYDNLDDFFSHKAEGDPVCVSKWDEYLRHLAILINNLHMVLEHTVILGGHVTPYFTKEDLTLIKKYVSERSTFDDDTSYIIQGKCLGDTVGIGSALPFIKEFIDGIYLFRIV